MEEGRFKEGYSCMVDGIGQNSYAQNSEYQKQLVTCAEDLIHETIIEHLDIDQNPYFQPIKCLKIADFGCSVGPNTFIAIQNIVSAFQNKYKDNKLKIPEFHVFLNDIVHNDFNSLFINIPSNSEYFLAAVPGSFHQRLFPEETLHFAHCATALHWVSRIPEEVIKKKNRGKIHYSAAGSMLMKEVQEAYAAQYREDMEAFLCARAVELVHGGVMTLVILGFPDGTECSESSIGTVFNILGSCLHDMVMMGKIEEDKVDCFNLPFYYTSPSELKSLIESNGLFSIEKICPLKSPMREKPAEAQIHSCQLRAVIGGLIRQHFGDGIVEELFKLHSNKLATNPILYDPKYWKETNYFAFLKLKK